MSDALYALNPVVSRRDEPDGTLLYNPDVDDVAVVNGSGLVVIEFLAEPHTVAEVAAHLAGVYDRVVPEQAAADAAAFVASLAPTYIVEVDANGVPYPPPVEAPPTAGPAAPGDALADP